MGMKVFKSPAGRLSRMVPGIDSHERTQLAAAGCRERSPSTGTKMSVAYDRSLSAADVGPRLREVLNTVELSSLDADDSWYR